MITHDFVRSVHAGVCPEKTLGVQTRRLLRACASDWLDEIFRLACLVSQVGGKQSLLHPKHLALAVDLEADRAKRVAVFLQSIRESHGVGEEHSLQALLALDDDSIPEAVRGLSLQRRGRGRTGLPTGKAPAGYRRRRTRCGATIANRFAPAQTSDAVPPETPERGTEDAAPSAAAPSPPPRRSACSPPSTS